MATVQVNYSKRTGQILNYKWTALLGRDEHGKQIRLTKRVDPLGMTEKAELKKMQRDADAWEEEQRAIYEQSRESIRERRQKEKDRENTTLIDFIDHHWMKKHVKDGKHTPDTIAFYSNMATGIKAYLKEKAPGMKVSQISKEDVLDYLTYLRTEAKTKRGTPYSETTIQHHFSTLRNILEYAVYVDYLREDPCKKLKQSDRPRRGEHEIDFLDDEQAVLFMVCLDSKAEKDYWTKHSGTHLFWKTLVNTLILTGLRRGELVGLQWGDLDTKGMMLHIRRNVTIDTSNKAEKDPEKKIHVGVTKGKTIRKVPISKYLLDLFVEYKAEQENKYGGTLLPNAYIFCRTDNAYLPIYPTEPTRQMSKFIKRHKLPNMSPHDLRHTAATLAIESGASVKEIQALLGHRDAATTLKFYAGISERTQRGTVEGIENMIRPKSKTESKAE